jgi:aminoglycoside/choline kinase family phosphotransferase/choline kinase
MARERRALLLAAGLGTRLRPLTDLTPKPLLTLGGETLLARIAGRLRDAGVTHLAVNAHHLADQVAAAAGALAGFDAVAVFPEPEILGTGGALWGARDFLRGDDPFLLYNGDVECDADLGALLEAHAASDASATLLLTDWPEVNSVRLGADGRVRDIGDRLAVASESGDRLLTYTGVAVFEPRVLNDLPVGPSHLVDALLRAIAEDPGGVQGYAPDNLSWNDLGTPGRYLDALLREGSAADTDAMAAAAAALPVLRESGFATETPERLALQGSDRGFWRVDGAVLMKSRRDDPDFSRYGEIGRFLHAEDLGGPEILSIDEDDAAVLMEDLGDDTLCRLAHADPDSRAARYHLALDALAALQTRGTAALEQCPAASNRTFDVGVVRWEHDYFCERFLTNEAGLGAADLAGLDADLALIGDAVLSQPYVLMHRDYQSQNILIKDGRARLVDFQGARRGPYAYDLMSLLRDAYVDLGDDLRDDLLAYYISALTASGGPAPADLARDATAAGLQRVMQALGAFGFLSRVKGKTSYRAHIPLAVRHLRELLRDWRTLSGERPLVRLEETLNRVETS